MPPSHDYTLAIEACPTATHRKLYAWLSAGPIPLGPIDLGPGAAEHVLHDVPAGSQVKVVVEASDEYGQVIPSSPPILEFTASGLRPVPVAGWGSVSDVQPHEHPAE